MMTNFSAFSICFLNLVTLPYGISQGQTVRPVDASPDALYQSVWAADNGDILELTEAGEYRIDNLIYINKKLTMTPSNSRTVFFVTAARSAFESTILTTTSRILSSAVPA